MSMENVMYYLNELNVYLPYIYIALGIILVILVIVLLVEVTKLNKSKNMLMHKIDMTKAMVDVTTTKKDILSDDLNTKYHDFMRVFSLIAVIKYFKSRDNRIKEKEFKAYEKHKKHLGTLIK